MHLIKTSLILLLKLDMSRPLRVLILEDSPDDAELLTIALQQGGYHPIYQRVDRAEAMTKALETQQWDIVLADYSMPQFNVFSALRLLCEHGLDLPFIIISGKLGEDMAAEAIKAGAHHCMLKDKLTRLIPVIDRELKEAALRAERLEAIAKLEYLTLYDRLTGLPNTTLFLEYLNERITQIQSGSISNVIPLHSAGSQRDRLASPPVSQKHPPGGFAVLYLDLDRYQTIKYSLGHWVADRLVAATARRLKNCLGDEAAIARVGEDEFAILLPDIENSHDAINVADLIHQVLKAPFQFRDRPMVFSTASIGIVMSQIGYKTSEQLLTAADSAMNHAKLNGQGQTSIFDLQMQRSAIERLHLEAELQQAIQAEQLHLNYQPIVCLNSGRLAGFEALVRWTHPKLGMISPGKFIPMAESTGLIIPLGEWVLKEACRQLSLWQEKFPEVWPIKISVNLSGIQLSHPDLLLKIDEILGKYSSICDSLKLEVTESVLMENAGRATAILEELKAKQIQISIDDFGTGYSSLSYLQCLPIDTLKIDRSFVSNMETQPKNAPLVKSIVALAHSLDMDLIAEGVETPKQMAILRSLGCEYGQGYLFSRPLNPEAAEHLLDNMSELSNYWQKSS